MRNSILAAALSFAAIAFASPAFAQQCPPSGYDRERLEQLRASNWEISQRRERERFARALAACVASPDPFLRDAVAFEALSTMLRGNQLSAGVMTDLTQDMLRRLDAEEGPGFERPFAALVLSELVRADRINPYYSEALRREALDRAIAYFVGVRDYRGFDEHEGWRHGVAHGSDVLLQFAVNSSIGLADQERIRDAIATQVAPAGHFYNYGEPQRLGRVILLMARRGDFTEDQWDEWFARVASPAPFESWNDVFASQEGLAKRHNTMAFLSYLAATPHLTWEDEEDDVILRGVQRALGSVLR